MKKVLINLLKKYKIQYLWVIVTLLIFQITRFIPVQKAGSIIDLLSDATNNKGLIIRDFIVFFVCVIIHCIVRSIYKYVVKATTYRFEKDLRNEIFSKFLNLKLEDMQNTKNGELMSYITKYVNDIRGGIYGIIAYGIRTIFAFGMLFILMLNVNWRLTLIVVIPMVIEGIIVNKLKEKIKKFEKHAQEEFTKMSEFVQESTDSIRTTKAFNEEEYQISLFKTKSEKVKNNYTKLGIYSSLLSASMGACFGICYALSFTIGTKLIIMELITVGEFIAFNSYIRDMYWPLKWIPQLITRIKKMQVAFNKLNSFYEINEEILGESKEQLVGDIVINNLDFSYDNTNVLKNINVTIKSGETLGIIGTIGSGKSTIANLLLKLYEVNDGQIFIDGKDINKIDIEQLRDSFCYITQESFLFSKSIRENIKLFREFLNDDIMKSSSKSALTEDIKNMENGIETIVGEKGITLSGGQKQRVAIARAFLFNKNFIIFDDTFSALDNRTEKLILENLKGFLENKTCIIISNRISDVKQADKIIVLDKGEIVQKGTHNELLSQEGLYRNFYNEQSSNEFLKEMNIGEEF